MLKTEPVFKAVASDRRNCVALIADEVVTRLLHGCQILGAPEVGKYVWSR